MTNESKDTDANTTLGAHHETREGDDYRAYFKGKGSVITGHTNGNFLSSKPLTDRFDEPEQTLDIKDMFPDDWIDQEVEYEISVKARLIKKAQD